MRHAFHSARAAAFAVSDMAGDGKLAGLWRKFTKELLDPYRPELHYMRGRGPKWRAKHGIADAR